MKFSKIGKVKFKNIIHNGTFFHDDKGNFPELQEIIQYNENK